MLTIVESLARESRTWAEQFAKNAVHKGNWDIVAYDLTGMCAIASAHLFTELRNAGIPCRLWSNRMHCFLTVTDGDVEYVVDVTATQFGAYRRVEIIPQDQTVMMEWWLGDIEHQTVADLRMYQIRSEWIKGQRVPKTLIADRRTGMDQRSRTRARHQP